MTPELLTVFMMLPIPCYVAWSWLHEVSHKTVAKRVTDVGLVIIYLYPHKHQGRFYWARTHYSWKTSPTEKERAQIALAPRLADLFAVIGLPFAGFFTTDPLFWAWTLFFGAGVIDLITGSIGFNNESDLKRVARGYDLSPWLFRVGGFVVVGCSIGVWGYGW